MALSVAGRQEQRQFRGAKHLAALLRRWSDEERCAMSGPNDWKCRSTSRISSVSEVVGDRLTIENRDGKRRRSTWQVSRSPASGRGLRAVLAGDLPGLARHYRYRLEGELSAWKLELEPLDKGARRRGRRIDIEGSKVQLSRIAIEEAQGDRTNFVLSPDYRAMSARGLSLVSWLVLVVLALACATTRLSVESGFLGLPAARAERCAEEHFSPELR